MTTPPRGFSGPVQRNGIGRVHMKAPLAAANGHEWSRSKATKSDVFDLGKGQTTTPGTPCPTLYEWCVGSLTSHSYFATRVGPPVYSPYPRRFESLTICWCDYKVSTFYSVILRPRVLVLAELNSRPPAWQPAAQPTEPSMRGEKVDIQYRFGQSHSIPKNWKSLLAKGKELSRTESTSWQKTGLS